MKKRVATVKLVYLLLLMLNIYLLLIFRVLVGAPKADSKYSASLKSPGAVFKCRVHTNPDKRCTELDMGRGMHECTTLSLSLYLF